LHGPKVLQALRQLSRPDHSGVVAFFRALKCKGGERVGIVVHHLRLGIKAPPS